MSARRIPLWSVMRPELAGRVVELARLSGDTVSRTLERIVEEYFREGFAHAATATFQVEARVVRAVARASEGEIQTTLSGTGIDELRRRLGDAGFAALLLGGAESPGLVRLLAELLRGG